MDTTEQNKKAAIEFLMAIGEGRLDIMDRLLDKDATWWVLGWGELPREGMLREIANIIRGTRSRTINILGAVAEGDKVAVEAASHFDFIGMDPYQNNYHFLLTFRNGRIVSGREYLDTAILAKTAQQQAELAKQQA